MVKRLNACHDEVTSAIEKISEVIENERPLSARDFRQIRQVAYKASNVQTSIINDKEKSLAFFQSFGCLKLKPSRPLIKLCLLFIFQLYLNYSLFNEPGTSTRPSFNLSFTTSLKDNQMDHAGDTLTRAIPPLPMPLYLMNRRKPEGKKSCLVRCWLTLKEQKRWLSRYRKDPSKAILGSAFEYLKYLGGILKESACHSLYQKVPKNEAPLLELSHV